ncbi:MAG TPA: HTTM domain-containing protein [Pirellulales bacterium]|nr:HTTM domain-containing protein [Pirellulales bacterium]
MLPDRSTLRWWLALGAGLVLLPCAYFFLVEPLLIAGHAQRGPVWLNHLLASSKDLPIAAILQAGRLYFSRSLFLFCAMLGAAAAWHSRQTVRKRWAVFLFEPDSPINLAVFRIALFAALFFVVSPNLTYLFASFPAELKKVPSLTGVFLRWLPFDPDVATVAAYGLKAVCLLGMLGVASRMNALLAVVLGYYVLGIQQSFGKVNHIHHLIWFAMVLAASRCGDALSVDAWIGRRQESWSRRLAGPAASAVYGVPLRVVWLLFGVIYFFPGFWKFWNCGFAWGLPENMRLEMYAKWSYFGDWKPLLRIDQYPLLLILGGLGTMLFEMGFVFLIFQRPTRYLAAAAGMMFHTMTNLVMTISFWPLQVLYVCFLPWDRISKRLLPSSQQEPTARAALPRDLVWTCAGLLAVNIALGATHQEHAWPFACYPTFASLMNPETTTAELDRLDLQGHEQPMDMNVIFTSIPEPIWEAMIGKVLDNNVPPEKVQALGRVLDRILKDQPGPLRLYTVRKSILPDQTEKPPLEKKLVYEFPLQSDVKLGSVPASQTHR